MLLVLLLLLLLLYSSCYRALAAGTCEDRKTASSMLLLLPLMFALQLHLTASPHRSPRIQPEDGVVGLHKSTSSCYRALAAGTCEARKPVSSILLLLLPLMFALQLHLTSSLRQSPRIQPA
jgi:hypothetical protein